MNAIERYNDARDREQHAFDVSRIGQDVRAICNSLPYDTGGVRAIRTRNSGVAERLARVVAFCPYSGAMPAWYAGRSLRIW